MGTIRDAKRTRHKILDAAAREFSQKGFDGTTIFSVAQRAKVSKQLITHHFLSKEKLFKEVLDLKYRPMIEEPETLPVKPTDLIAERFRKRAGHGDYIRFLAWEAAGGRGASVPAKLARQRRIAKFRNTLRQMQAAGKLPQELDHTLIQLAILSLTTYPMAFGQMTKLVTGLSPADPRFKTKWIDFLRLAGQRLLAVDKPARARLQKNK